MFILTYSSLLWFVLFLTCLKTEVFRCSIVTHLFGSAVITSAIFSKLKLPQRPLSLILKTWQSASPSKWMQQMPASACFLLRDITGESRNSLLRRLSTPPCWLYFFFFQFLHKVWPLCTTSFYDCKKYLTNTFSCIVRTWWNPSPWNGKIYALPTWARTWVGYSPGNRPA